MSNDAKVRIRFDTRQAKSELRDLLRESAGTAKKISSGVRGAIGRGLGAVGLGGGIGAGIAAVRGATESGVGDVIGEALGGIGKEVERFFIGDLGDKARAAKSAREETIQAFGAIAGQRGEIPPEARTFFNNVKQIREKEEHGRTLFESDEKMRGPGIKELIDRILEGFGKLIDEAIDRVISAINPFD